MKRRTRYPAISLECLAPAVAAISVRFDHEMVSGPEEVDRVRANGGVDLGHRKAVPATETEERTLQLASSAIGLDLTERKPEVLGLAGGLADHARRLHVAKIGEGAGRDRDGDTPMARRLMETQ